jgi:hypothetical protein
MEESIKNKTPGMPSTDISKKDRELLRRLAAQVAELAARPEEARKAALWKAHNDLKTHEPLVFIDPENGWHEILPESALVCEGQTARSWEFELRKRVHHGTVLKDDFVIDDAFNVPHVYTDTGWGVKLTRIGGENGGAYHIQQAVEDYERDFDKVHFPEILVDDEASDRLLALAQATFDGLLSVHRHTQWWWSLGLTWRYIDLRGLEDFLCDFLLEGEWVHRMMELLCRGSLDMLDMLERDGLLSPNTGNHYVGSGGFGFTDALPRTGSRLTAKDMWGFVESQETVSASPDLYGEFILPYHRRIAERFGLNCYGCCEPFEPRWQYVRQLPRLRRVSCSPWTDRAAAAELLGDQYISSLKLSPAPLSRPRMDEGEVRAHLREVLAHNKRCVPELIMKDNHTLGGNPSNATRWVEIAREEIARL